MDIDILSRKFCDYSLAIKGFSLNTIKRYKQAIRYYRQFANITNIEEITVDNVRAMFFDGRINRGWRPNGFLHYHKSLMVFFRWCIKNGYMSSNPLSEVEVPKLDNRIPSKLTKQEAMKILEVVYNYPWGSSFLRHRNYAIFSVFMFAGLRRQELVNLKFMDVDIENLSIFVKSGKGNKDRVIPMNYTLAQSLKNYIVERVKIKATCPNFFVSNKKNVGICTNAIMRLIKQINKASGIYFHAHKLRHTFATLMLEGGCDIYSLSKMMGHNDIKTTTIYLYASVEHLRGEITKHPLNNI